LAVAVKRFQQRWVTLAAWLVVAAVASVHVFFVLHTHPLLADLGIYRGAVTELISRGELYDYQAANGGPFTYPPFAGLLLAALVGVSERAAQIAWTATTLLVVCLLASLVAARLPAQLIAKVPHRLITPLVAGVLLASAPAASNLRLGQISLFLFFLALVDCLMELPRPLQGVFVGLVAAIKLTPLMFVALLWLAGRRRAAVTATATCALATGLAWIVLPGQSHRFWLVELWNTARIGNLAQGGNQSVNGMLLRWGFEGMVKELVWAGVVVVVVALALVRAHRALQADNSLLAVAIIGAATVAASPVSWNHHQMVLLLAAAGILTTVRHQWWWTAGVLVIMIIPIGDLMSSAIPYSAPLASNLRALLAIAIACCVPFAATAMSRRGNPELGDCGREKKATPTIPLPAIHP
jgi:alpha-1,2-mannosyltransferase